MEVAMMSKHYQEDTEKDWQESSVISRMSKQYQAAMEKDWQKFEKCCVDWGTADLPITVAGDTALHIAVYSEDVDLVKRLLEIAFIRMENSRGDTVLHEAAGVGNVGMAEFLLDKDEELLDVKNNRGETPLFRAAASGKTKMVHFLAQRAMERGTMSNHTRRGETCILHIAVLSRYFDTALQLLQIDHSLQSLRDQSGMTCLQLLANMPSAFKSGFPMSKLKGLLYFCLPDDDDDLEGGKHDKTWITSSQRKDLECGCAWSCPVQFRFWIGGRAISRIYSALWRCIAQGFPGIRRLWDIKKQQTRAVKLAKCLAKDEYDTCMGTNLGDKPHDNSMFYMEDMEAQVEETYKPGYMHRVISVARKEDMDDQVEETDKPGDRDPDTFVACQEDMDDQVKETDKLGDRDPDIFVACQEDMDDQVEEPDKSGDRDRDIPVACQVEEPDKSGDRERDIHVAFQEDMDDQVEEIDQLGELRPPPISSSESPLLSAAKNGIIELVKVILKLYPEAIEVINERKENIFHVAVSYRRKEILDLLQNWPVSTLWLRRRINCNGDSILHQAAYLRARQLRDRPGEALRMQSEIQWFERVRKLVPPYFINHRNNENRTAKQLFTSRHKKLMENGRKWMDQTTKACTIVAVLIATVAFTCAYTTPGGSNSKTGHPLLLKETPFRIFTIADTLSLCFSLTSVVLFLSIMTSKMGEEDFRRSLPLKLVLGLTTLFLAVAAMMVAFAATLALMVGKRLHWAATPVYTIACCPVTVFLVLGFSLYLNIAWYTVRDMLQSFIGSLPLGTRMIRSSVH